MPAFVGLVAGQGHGLVLVREAFKNSDVHEVILVHLNLDEIVLPSNQLAFELQCLEHWELLVLLLLQLGLHLVGDSLGLGRGRLRGGRRSAHHLGGRRGGSVWTPGGGHAGAADTPGAADTRGAFAGSGERLIAVRR